MNNLEILRSAVRLRLAGTVHAFKRFPALEVAIVHTLITKSWVHPNPTHQRSHRKLWTHLHTQIAHLKPTLTHFSYQSYMFSATRFWLLSSGP